MALEKQVISVDFGKGLDTKTDPKKAIAGKMLMLENAVFTNPSRISKDPGFDDKPLSLVGGGAISNPKFVSEYRGELVCGDGINLYAYSSSLGAWINRGYYSSTEVNTLGIDKSDASSVAADSAVAGNIALYCWRTASIATGTQSILAAAYDWTSQTVIMPTTALASGSYSGVSYYANAAKLGSSTLAAAYVNSSNQLAIKILSASSSSVSMGAQIVIDTLTFAGINCSADFVNTSTGGVIAYNKSSTGGSTPDEIIIKTLDTSGNIVNTYTLSGTGKPWAIHIAVDPTNGNLWIYWSDRTNANSQPIYYAVLSSTLSLVLAQTTIATGIDNLFSIAALSVSTTQQNAFYTYESNAANQSYRVSYRAVSSAGSVGGESLLVTGAYLISRPFSLSSRNYVWIWDLLSSTAVLLDLGTGTAVAKALYGQLSQRITQNTVKVNALSSTKAQTCYLSSQGLSSFSVEFNSSKAYHSVLAGESLVLNGSIVSMYDGQSVCELGFHGAPQIPTATPSGTGGNLSAGTYLYYAVFTWYDELGNFHQSQPSLAKSVTTSAGTSSVALSITPCNLSRKSNPAIQVQIFRTQVNGTIPHYVSSLTNNATQDVLSYTDTSSDSSIGSNAILYTSGGVLDNDPPPASMLMATHNNRLMLVDSENPNSVWPSKTYVKGNGLSMSGALAIQVDSKGGDISAIAEMDDKLIIFKNDVPFYLAGDAANAAGTGSTLSDPQMIPSDAGCTQPKSVVLTPRGILRMTDKGWYLLDRSLSDSYWGAEVEAYNGQSFTAALIVKGKNQIRFLTDSGSSLIYDYAMNQWSTRTNQNGVSATNWNGCFVYVRTDGHIYQQNAAKFLDGSSSYRMRGQTSWLALSGVQGFQRIQRIAILGDYANGASATHGVQVSAAYDFNPSFSAPVTYSPGGVSGSGQFQYRQHLSRQKCDSLSLLIEEIVTGDSLEFIDLTNLSLEIAAKRGLNKLPIAQSVG